MQTVNKDSNDFAEIRREGYVYVDNTAWFHRLATAKGEKIFFLVRPRRFDKKKFPVIHLNMGMCAVEDCDRFSTYLPECMKYELVGAVCKYNPKLTPEANFGNAIDALAKNDIPPVILIDEYDDPVVERVRSSLVPIYGQMRDRSGKAGVAESAKLKV